MSFLMQFAIARIGLHLSLLILSHLSLVLFLSIIIDLFNVVLLLAAIVIFVCLILRKILYSPEPNLKCVYDPGQISHNISYSSVFQFIKK